MGNLLVLRYTADGEDGHSVTEAMRTRQPGAL